MTQFLIDNFYIILQIVSILVTVLYLIIIFPKLKAEETRTNAIFSIVIFLFIFSLILGIIKYIFERLDDIINYFNNFEIDTKFILYYVLIPLILIQLILRLIKKRS